MPAEIVMRHRPTHFAHVFSGGGYASAYYSYMWSEVLDADAFAAFEETGDIFDPATAKKLHDHVYSAGGTRDPEALYIAFRGRLPTPDALLKQRGLADVPATALQAGLAVQRRERPSARPMPTSFTCRSQDWMPVDKPACACTKLVLR